MIKVNFLVYLGLLVTLFSCTGKGTLSNDVNFVSVDSLVTAKIGQMNNEIYQLEKKVTYEDTTLTNKIDSPDLSHELAPFTKILIPVVSWNGNYTRSTDTVGDKIIYLYEASDSSVDLNRFVLHRNIEGRVVAMHFNYRTHNLFTQSNQFMIWEEDSMGNLHYRIEGKQHTKIFGEEIYKIEGRLTRIVKE